jgi:hypothetical protein
MQDGGFQKLCVLCGLCVNLIYFKFHAETAEGAKDRRNKWVK